MSEIKTYDLEGNTCPYCNKKVDAVTTSNKDNPRQPQEGDLTVCFDCGNISVFGHGMKMRPCRDEDLENASEDLVVSLFQLADRIKQRRMFDHG